MTTIADLRKRRNQDMQTLAKSLERAGKFEADDNEDGFWKLERDKAGNGAATIRFLPAYAGEDATEADELPYVTEYTHGFQGPTGRWYIEKCLTTIHQEDPVQELNRKLWKGSEEDKKQARLQGRRTKYIAQIRVISDPKNPENDGKVFFYKFGKKIFDKIKDAQFPTFEDDKPLNVFDLWEGANFRLRIKTVDKYPNYDSSAFESPSPIAATDDEILEIVNQQKSLGKFLDPKNFKSYDELKKKLDNVLSGETGSTQTAEDMVKKLREAARVRDAEAEKAEPESEDKKESTDDVGTSVSDDADIEDFFSKM